VLLVKELASLESVYTPSGYADVHLKCCSEGVYWLQNRE